MHFLCLHGMGTNSKIFLGFAPDLGEKTLIRTYRCVAAIRYELGDHHTYEFVEGTIPWPIAPEIKPLALGGRDEYFSYFDPSSVEQGMKAVEALDAYIAAEGPFDAIMGFSQGAYLAATLLALKVKQNPQKQLMDPIFKCAVFFSGDCPYDPVVLRGEILDLDMEGETITIPTTHVWGHNDKVWPGRALKLSKMCKKKGRTVYIHDGGHDIPGSKSKAAVIGIVHAIRRTVDSALCTQ